MVNEPLDLDEPFTVEVLESDGTTTVALTGELDAATMGVLQASLPPVAQGGELVLDLRRLAFMDSTGIRVLMSLDIRSRTEGWSLRIIRRPGAVQRVLDVCRVPERVLTVDEPAERG